MSTSCTQLWNWAYDTISLLASYKLWRFLLSWCSYPIIYGRFFQLHWLTILKIWISLISVASWHRIVQNSCIVQMNQIFHVSPFDQDTQALLTHKNSVKQLGASQFHKFTNLPILKWRHDSILAGEKSISTSKVVTNRFCWNLEKTWRSHSTK